MNSRSSALRWPIRTAMSAGTLVLTIGGLVLFGWARDIETLKSVVPGLVTMKANTALGLLLSGAALVHLARARAAQSIRLATATMAACLMALGALTLSEDIFGWNPGIDQWLFHDGEGTVDSSSPG